MRPLFSLSSSPLLWPRQSPAPEPCRNFHGHGMGPTGRGLEGGGPTQEKKEIPSKMARKNGPGHKMGHGYLSDVPSDTKSPLTKD